MGCDEWIYASPLPSPRRYISAARVNNDIYVLGKIYNFSTFELNSLFTGGRYDDGDGMYRYDNIFVYNSESDVWSEIGKMEIPRSSHRLDVINDFDQFCN